MQQDADDSDDVQLDETMDVDASDDEGASGVPDVPLVPMPKSGGIKELREKLHAKMAALRRGGRYAADGEEAGSRDELLEERRRQRAAMRERRRKETKEKIRAQEEAKGKKGKEKERAKGPTTKVSLVESSAFH